MKRNLILKGDVREVLQLLPDESVHCCVTSPPYWGQRDYKVDGQLGLEATPEEYVANMVAVFREVRRVLRKDGTCWVNLGDSYAHSTPGGGSVFDNGRTDGRVSYEADKARGREKIATLSPGLKQKDLCGIPWRVALALQADGWWLRSDIIWAKPNPMPESVTDRPTKSHEYVFLLSKSGRYFYDAEAVKEQQTASTIARAAYGWAGVTDDGSDGARTGSTFRRMAESGEKIGTIPADGRRNRRTVWTIATEPSPIEHYATFPTELVKPCILAGTSEHGCCSVCGAPWERVVEQVRESSWERRKADGHVRGLATSTLAQQKQGSLSDAADRAEGGFGVPAEYRTVGWQPTCKHEAPVVPCIVLDPFGGSGTTGLVAKTAGRDYILIELNPDYIEMAEKRINVSQERLL